MRIARRADSLFSRLRFHAWLLALIWTACIAASLIWNLHEQDHNTLAMARNSAQLTFENDILYRRWAANQGGVYVRASDHTPPNFYLKVPDRDLTTTDGANLTLVNPAYMARLVHELAGAQGGTRGHITSLRPLRPENAPDAWENAGLQAFEKGAREVSSIETMDDGEYLRLMRPFLAEKACLKCHAEQGYKEGDIRGGISVSVPMAPLRAIQKPVTGNLAMAHIGLWIVGLFGIGLARRDLEKQLHAKEKAEATLRESEERLRIVTDNSPDPIFLKDRFGRMLLANPATLDIIGKPANQVMGRTDRELYDDPETSRVFMENDRRIMDSDTMEVIEETINAPGGRRVYLSTKAPCHDAQGRVIGLVGVARDITERKRAEEDTRRHAAQLEKMNAELERFNRAMVDRELRMIQLKKEVNELCAQAGQAARYSVDFDKEQL